MTTRRGRSGVAPAVVVDVSTASTVDPDELREALAGVLTRFDWFEVGLRPDVVDPTEADVVADDHDGGDRAGDHDGDDRTGDDGGDDPAGHDRAGAADDASTGDVPGGDQLVAARAVTAGAPTVVVCGDDGTVRRCLEAVAGTATSLGVVSLGPGTLLASNLALPPGLGSIPDAVTGPIRRIDVGDANGEVFAVHAGFGVDVLQGRNGHGGSPLGAFVRRVVDLSRRLTRVIVHVDGVQRFEGRTVCLVVANCSRGPGRVELFPGAEPDDAELDLAVLAPRSPLARIQVLWRLLAGRPQDPHHVRRLRGEWVHVQLDRSRPYELDGDARPPRHRLDMRVWPAALAVHVPAITPDDGAGADDGGEDEAVSAEDPDAASN